MGRERKQIAKVLNGRRGSYFAIFGHPVSKRSCRINLGTDSAVADGKLRWLNEVFMDATKWRNLPDGFPPDLQEAWLDASESVKASRKGGVRVDGQKQAVDPEEVAMLNAVIKDLERQLIEQRQKYLDLKRKYKKVTGGDVREGPSPTLKEAAAKWKRGYTGRDAEWTKIVGYDVDRFVQHFGEETLIDEMEGQESEIDSWLRGMKTKGGTNISAGRRAQVRRAVLKFLDDSGVQLSRKNVTPIKRAQIRRDRGGIRWLDPEQAIKVAELLPEPWKSAFEIQCAIGLRPSEVATLKRGDFDSKQTALTLSPIPESDLTLKTGPRTIGIHRHPKVLPVIKRLFEGDQDVFFTDAGKPWRLDLFHRAFNAALKVAATAAGVTMKVDCRIGRRTCASNLIRAGRSVEQVAALLGDDPKTIREHYATILPQEV